MPDRIVLFLLVTPMLIAGLGVALYAFETARAQSNAAKRIALSFGALAVASVAVCLTFLIVTDDDAKWCTKANRDDPGCRLHGGE